MTHPKPPEPAAATQTTEVDRGPVSAESDAQRGLQEAQDARAKAEAEASSIASDLQSARAELARLEALPEITAEELLAEEHGRRRVRRLEGELKQARAAVADAAALLEAAQNVADRAHLAVLDADLQELDRAFTEDAAATRDRLTERRAAIFAKLREANEIARSLDRNPDTFNWSHRGALAAIGPETTDALIAAAERVNLEVRRERERISATQHAIADARRFDSN